MSKSLRQRVVEARKKAQVSVDELAIILNVPTVRVALVERGLMKPSKRLKERLLDWVESVEAGRVMFTLPILTASDFGTPIQRQRNKSVFENLSDRAARRYESMLKGGRS